MKLRPRTFKIPFTAAEKVLLASRGMLFVPLTHSLAERIRAQGRMPVRKSRRNDRGFCEQRQRRKDFERAARDGDSDAVPFPRPLLLLEDARTLLQKRKLCPKNLCHQRGSPHDFGPISVQNQASVCHFSGVQRTKANRIIRTYGKVGGFESRRPRHSIRNDFNAFNEPLGPRT